MAYLPIEDYGLIGNMRTVALVGMNGSIDWFCPVQFDSPTNALISRFLCDDGVVEVVDYMPVGVPEESQQARWLIRRVRMIRGSLPMRLVCRPAFNQGESLVFSTVT